MGLNVPSMGHGEGGLNMGPQFCGTNRGPTSVPLRYVTLPTSFVVVFFNF